MVSKIFSAFPFELKKVASNTIDAAQSISRNIAEGYCRRSLKEYLNYLNYALGSCGELHSSYFSCMKANHIKENQYEEIDQLYYKVENGLLKLIETLQKKLKNDKGEDCFHSK